MNNLKRILEQCVLCPRLCKVDRYRGGVGFCGIGTEIRVAHYGPHFGEEPPISGIYGSGNIFFSSCNLRCVYCQNFQISHEGMGKSITIDELTEIFFSLQSMGLHNINLVSPTPYVPFLAAAIENSKRTGIQIPFIYNSHAYETVDTLRMLDGLIDIYLPDFKYWSNYIAHRLSHARDYPSSAQQAILEMTRQVGNLVIEQGIARKGILVRHLVLPSNLAGSRQVLEWIKRELGGETYISLMAQYKPLYRAVDFPMLTRRVKHSEYDALVDFLIHEGFNNVFIQDLESAEAFVPDFECDEPFAGQKLME